MIEQFGPALVLRLGLEPLPLPPGVQERPVTVDRASPRAKKRLEVCAITWENSQEMEDRVLKLRFLRNEHDITEDAAIGIMLLLAHEFEGLTLLSVLQIGSGGDYLMRLPHGVSIQVEVSGIFRDDTGHSGNARLKQKCTQVLSKADAGFASVSIFHHRNGLNMHSYLHYVQRPAGAAKARRRSKSKGEGTMALLASDTATRLTVQAEAALRSGDTGQAKALFKQAGEALEQAVQRTRKESEKSLHRFLAATQYFKGGHYGKASRLCNRIQVNLLPDSARELYLPFLKDVRRRADPSYTKELREEFLDHYVNGRYQAVLELLKSHPYVYTPTAAAFIRAVCCENLKEYRAAALFFADAMRLSPDDVNLVFVSASHTFALIQQGSFEEAQVYLDHQMDLLPNALTYINASMLRFNEASSANVDGLRRQKLFEEQVGYFSIAWEKFRNLPAPYLENRELRDFMILALEGAALAFQRLGQLEKALAVCAEGVAFAPQSPHVRTIRGIIAYPEANAVSDFEEAIRLGEPLYYPFYFLAHNALLTSDFEAVLRRCDQASQRRPSPEVLAQLLEWKAISLWHLFGNPDEIRRLFRQAIAIAPGRPGIVRSLARFEQWTEARSLPLPDLPQADISAEKPNGEYMTNRKRPLETNLPRKTRERELAFLAPVGSPT